MCLKLNIITLDQKTITLDGLKTITLPASNGKLGILENHAPLLTVIDDFGVINLSILPKFPSVRLGIVLFGGVAKIKNNEITIFCNKIEKSIDMDKSKVIEDMKTVVLTVKNASSNQSKALALRKLRKCKARVQALDYFYLVA